MARVRGNFHVMLFLQIFPRLASLAPSPPRPINPSHLLQLLLKKLSKSATLVLNPPPPPPPGSLSNSLSRWERTGCKFLAPACITWLNRDARLLDNLLWTKFSPGSSGFWMFMFPTMNIRALNFGSKLQQGR